MKYLPSCFVVVVPDAEIFGYFFTAIYSNIVSEYDLSQNAAHLDVKFSLSLNLFSNTGPVL
jgi:hypothetical protein